MRLKYNFMYIFLKKIVYVYIKNIFNMFFWKIKKVVREKLSKILVIRIIMFMNWNIL